MYLLWLQFIIRGTKQLNDDDIIAGERTHKIAFVSRVSLITLWSLEDSIDYSLNMIDPYGPTSYLNLKNIIIIKWCLETGFQTCSPLGPGSPRSPCNKSLKMRELN